MADLSAIVLSMALSDESGTSGTAREPPGTEAPVAVADAGIALVAAPVGAGGKARSDALA